MQHSFAVLHCAASQRLFQALESPSCSPLNNALCGFPRGALCFLAPLLKMRRLRHCANNAQEPLTPRSLLVIFSVRLEHGSLENLRLASGLSTAYCAQ